jgi:hypothetical protein
LLVKTAGTDMGAATASVQHAEWARVTSVGAADPAIGV